MNTLIKLGYLSAATWSVMAAGVAFWQVLPAPRGDSISTPCPIHPAASTTNPNALTTEGQNPYLGSTPTGRAAARHVGRTFRQSALSVRLRIRDATRW
jgi:hypothetical protein